ncbi:GNAT family N-acetyltransferase [Jatrophihabitans telluris]|uniref:GNAT family N-acetyltransferase n=1 Tax=Jatrophihabitans telluris TaxID=2038343 RepID=A0ABY4R0N3_9ACTN|nr:bifunctional GNAT family N-acetyltransferase/acetate--CoA ligase family protein [Jatrophihabitans telluris]UQX89448.1 GNAT family N-acetyltransferase [Jatrophihabitans telluris]
MAEQTVQNGATDEELAVSYNYPPHWEADVVAADGGTMHLRPITPDDADKIVQFHGKLSIRTRYLRYFSAYPTIPSRDLLRFSRVNHRDRVALAAWLGSDIIAIGRFESLSQDGVPTGTAEVAFVVADAHQGRGIGSVLLEHLAEAGREVGIARFEALVLAENSAMIRVFLDAGYQPSRQFDGSEVTLEFDIASTPQTEKVMAEREQRAESRSIRRLLFPASVAVIGASADESKIGNLVFENLQKSSFTGPIYPVNTHARSINGVLAYPSVADVPGTVDLAVLTIPAETVGQVVEDCSDRQVRGLVVISSGFGESGDAQARRDGLVSQRNLVNNARAHGMRVVGPNCLGVINTDPAISLNASLATVAPLRGRAGFFCQSGALGVAVLGEAARRGLGVSTFVSAGNRADVSGNDLLQFWEGDPDTEIALLYLESFGNPRKFARLARRFARRKPIVAVKSGRGSVVAGLQHTSVEIPESSVQALFEASGVIRTETLAQLFDVAILLTTQPLPAGDRVAVVGHSTALGVLVADALAVAGLKLARLVDVGVDASTEAFTSAVSEALDADDVDAVVSIFVPPMHRGQEKPVAEGLRRIVAGASKPVLSTFLGFDGVPAELAVAGDFAPMRGSIPSYSSPERAVAALAHVVRYAAWRQREPGLVPELAGIDTEAARRLVTEVMMSAPSGRRLTPAETQQLLGYYGIELVPGRTVFGPDEALAAAEELGWPVALKAPGAVRLHLGGAEDLHEAWRSLATPTGTELTVQRMAPRGVDTVLEVHDDRSFGSLVSFGVGGVATELLDDRAYAVVPLTSLDAAELISAPKAFPLLTGYGGAEPADIPSLAEMALRLSQLADDLPEVVECVLAPMVAEPAGAHVLSAGIRIARPAARADLGARRLRGL